ncbi:helix-turn-helix domain-containing protein [Ihubacter massiliensis]|uniref:helix-turn-helix domain-containing protein n=1 Tax=Ihubacter massiliensis TaxID=1852367 RepID=UPI0011DE4F7A|nr:helix-turn-helix domain-containing protein [Ihubacter massiliensis]MCO7122042.1 helix-turn-helix domain-containing protein [Ihubacter massiliensis]MCO7124160.1 helix-turn-helix domain-containing protein [Ihubacter massiliensis]
MNKKLENLIKSMSEEITSSDIVAAEQLAKISATITKSRIAMKMNQCEFANFLGVSQGMVSKWESEDYNFTVENLAKICDKLNLELDINMKNKEQFFRGIQDNSNWKINRHSGFNKVCLNGVA